MAYDFLGILRLCFFEGRTGCRVWSPHGENLWIDRQTPQFYATDLAYGMSYYGKIEK